MIPVNSMPPPYRTNGDIMKTKSLFLFPALLLAGFLTCVASCSKNDPQGTEGPSDSVQHIRWGSRVSPLDNVVISWRSKGGSDKFAWGYTPACEKGDFPASRKTDLLGGLNCQQYTFDQLQPSSTIYYTIYDSWNNIWTTQQTFQTAPDPATNQFSFSAGGDCRTNVDDWHMVSEAIERKDFALFLGDLVNNGWLWPEWENWYSYGEKFITGNLVFYAHGNHDKGNIFYDNLVNPGNGKYYAFTFGNAVFIGLEDQEYLLYDKETAFIDSVFKSNTDKTWRFVFFHKPFYTSGGHAGEMDGLYPTWWKLFDDYGVDLIFNGHEHNYLRTKPINRNVSDTSAVAEYGSGPGQGRCQIISGSYGAPRYAAHHGWFVEVTSEKFCYTTVEVNGNSLLFEAFDAETGEKLDEMTLNK
jgi:hypothetical protein